MPLLLHPVLGNSLAAAILLPLAFYVFVTPLFVGRQKKPNAPVFGYRSFLEPTFLLQSRFILGAKGIINKAYKTMKNKPYVLKRWDIDFLVLPMKYLEDIRLVNPAKLSSKGAQTANLAPEFTSLEFLYHSNLHVDVLRKKLTPELYTYVDRAEEELVYGWKTDVPHTDEWISVDIDHHVRSLVARMTAKIFMGAPTCRDDDWLRLSTDFTVDLFTLAFTIKMFPPWLYSIVAAFLPARYRLNRQLKTARRIVGRLTQEHKAAKAARKVEEDTLLNWMLDNGTADEVKVHEMAARQCVLTLASIHTTAATVSHMLYDLCANPEWFEVLREEIFAVAEEFGGPPGQETKKRGVSAKEWCARLDKMDSFVVESQRHNPLIMLNPQRLAYQDITLKDGTFIPKNYRLAFAAYEHSMDPAIHPNPTAFDPLRSYRKRQAAADQRDKHKAGLTSPENLAFGYGNQACAGRQFAVAEIKLIMARLLYEFEFSFPPGQKGRGDGRPKLLNLNEMCFSEMGVRLLMRKRRVKK
ncbi:cytochrome P450 [Aspergillus crustosus]